LVAEDGAHHQGQWDGRLDLIDRRLARRQMSCWQQLRSHQ
jgi:hypothetical protein